MQLILLLLYYSVNLIVSGVKHSTVMGHTHTHTHTRLTALCLGLPGWAGTRKAKLIWILLKQETVSGSGISWAICKSAPCSRQITTPAPHRSVFYRPDALPVAQPTVSKHWRRNGPIAQKNEVENFSLHQFACVEHKDVPTVSCWKTTLSSTVHHQVE